MDPIDAKDAHADTAAVTADATQTAPVLDIVRAMLRELHPHQTVCTEPDLHSDFDRALGFDSLARIVLLARINDAFAVELPESVLETAETPADLVAALVSASPRSAPRAGAIATPFPQQPTGGVPDHATTLVEVLAWHTTAQGSRIAAHASHGATDNRHGLRSVTEVRVSATRLGSRGLADPTAYAR